MTVRFSLPSLFRALLSLRTHGLEAYLNHRAGGHDVLVSHISVDGATVYFEVCRRSSESDRDPAGRENKGTDASRATRTTHTHTRARARGRWATDTTDRPRTALGAR